MTSTKLIFLDVDGVIRKHDTKGFSQAHVNELARILRETGCKIVLSSGWRLPTLVQTLSSNFGQFMREMDSGLLVLDSVIDVTPERDSRAEEIRTWLEYTDYNVEQYIVLDDEEVPDPNLVKTEYLTGLTKEIADDIIRRFGRV